MVNSSIHKSSRPPSPSSDEKSPGYSCSLWYDVLSGVEKSTVRSVLRDGSHTSLLLMKHIRNPYISFFISFLSLTLLLTFSKVRFFPLTRSLGSVFCPGRLVCVEEESHPLLWTQSQQYGGLREVPAVCHLLLCLAPHGLLILDLGKGLDQDFFIEKDFLFTLSWNLSVGKLGKLVSYSVVYFASREENVET